MKRQLATRLVVVAVAVLGAAGSCASSKAFFFVGSDKTYRTTEQKVVGKLEWDIVDCANGRTIAHGNKTVELRDITIVEHRDENGELSFYDKRINLEQAFYIEMSEFPEQAESDVDGFGMVAGRDGERTFCWEWFNVDGKSHATKLQETGAVEISVKAIDSRWEVVSTKFLSDVSFRIQLEDVKGSLAERLRWRVNIRKGSEVKWPSLVGDKVISNG